MRRRDEPLSRFRFRYARYCLTWLLPLGLGTLCFLGRLATGERFDMTPGDDVFVFWSFY